MKDLEKEYIQNSKIKIDSMLPPNAKKKADEVLREVLSMLDELEPNEDDKEVKWIRDTSHGMVRYQCDKCKGYKTLAYNFCPDCGAKMDVIKPLTLEELKERKKELENE